MRSRHSISRKKSLALFTVFALALFVTACGKKSDSSNGTGEYKKSLNKADEAAATRTLQRIFSAQTQYMLSHGEEFGTFDQLVAERFLDERFKATAPVVEGYVFKMQLTSRSDGQSATFTVNADPDTSENPATAGARHLYMDYTNNVVRGNANQPAGPGDAPLQ